VGLRYLRYMSADLDFTLYECRFRLIGFRNEMFSRIQAGVKRNTPLYVDAFLCYICVMEKWTFLKFTWMKSDECVHVLFCMHIENERSIFEAVQC
jgi:hypothetical protein